MASQSKFYPGKRLSYDGNLCTVRYVGSVAGTKGEWLGVEWDEPGRGKHAGNHEGVQYFECRRKDLKCASFIRPTRPSDSPRTLLEALKEKYASEDFEGFIYFNADLKKKQDAIVISGKEVEEVGFDKIRQKLADFYQLRIVVLDGLCMTEPVDYLLQWPWKLDESDKRLHKIRETCPKIIELDLSRNLFEDWREVLAIVEQLPLLSSLKADGNRFAKTFLETEAEYSLAKSVFSKIRTLGLEDTLLPWITIIKIAGSCEFLTSLSASRNGLQRLQDPISTGLLSSLTTLTLEDNGFEALSDLAPLNTLPNLQDLRLKQNMISSVFREQPAETLKKLLFPASVIRLDISYNEVASWSFINALATIFPGLVNLRVAHNPLYDSLLAADGKRLTADDGYILTIARLGRLQILNFSPISAKERLNAEAFYLSQIATELSNTPESEQQSVLDQHPRYKELCEEYGDPNISRVRLSNLDVLARRLVNVIFRLGPSALEKTKPGTSKSITREIPKSYSIYTLYGIAGKAFNLSPMKLRLFWETDEDELGNMSKDIEEEWDSEEELANEGGKDETTKKREVELTKGTRTLGGWVEGNNITIRLETQ